MVAVGTALSGGPPHGSVLAELPRTDLTLGAWRRSERRNTGAGSRAWLLIGYFEGIDSERGICLAE